MKVRGSFANFTATTLEMLSSSAPTIGMDKNEFLRQVIFFVVIYMIYYTVASLDLLKTIQRPML